MPTATFDPTEISDYDLSQPIQLTAEDVAGSSGPILDLTAEDVAGSSGPILDLTAEDVAGSPDPIIELTAEDVGGPPAIKVDQPAAKAVPKADISKIPAPIGLSEWWNKEAKLIDLTPFAGSFYKLWDAGTLAMAAMRYTAGNPDEGDEKLLADNYALASRDHTWLANVANIVWNIPAFSVELAATAGIGRAAYEFGKRGSVIMAEKLIENASKNAFVKIGSRIAGGVAAASLQAPVAGGLKVATEAVQRNAPKVAFGTDETGEIHGQTFDRGESWSVAIPKAYVNNFIEVATEMSGLMIGEAGAKILSKIPWGNKVAAFSKYATAWLASHQNKGLRDFLETVAVKSHFHGTLPEIGEELLGDALRPILIEGEDYKVPTLEYLGTMGISFMIPSVAKHTAASLFNFLRPKTEDEGTAPPPPPADNLDGVTPPLKKPRKPSAATLASIKETADKEAARVAAEAAATPSEQITLVSDAHMNNWLKELGEISPEGHAKYEAMTDAEKLEVRKRVSRYPEQRHMPEGERTTSDAATVPPADKEDDRSATPLSDRAIRAAAFKVIKNQGVEDAVAIGFVNLWAQSAKPQSLEAVRTEVAAAFKDAGFFDASHNTYSSERNLREAAGLTEEEILDGAAKHEAKKADISSHNRDLLAKLTGSSVLKPQPPVVPPVVGVVPPVTPVVSTAFKPIRVGKKMVSVTTRPDTSTWQVTSFLDDYHEQPSGHDGFKTLGEALESVDYKGEENRNISSLGYQSPDNIYAAIEQNPGSNPIDSNNFVYASPRRPLSGLRVPATVQSLSFTAIDGRMAGIVETSRPLTLGEMYDFELAPVNKPASSAYWKLVADVVHPGHEKILAGKDSKPSVVVGPRIVEFTTSKGSTYVIQPDGTTIRDKAPRPEHPGEKGIQQQSQNTWYVTESGAQSLGEIQTKGGGPKRKISVVKSKNVEANKYLGVMYIEGKDAGKWEQRTVVEFFTTPEVGLIPVESFKDGKSIHFGNAITSVRSQKAPGVPVVDPLPPKVPSADEYERIQKEISAAIKHPLFREQTDAGTKFRDAFRDLEQEAEFHKPAALAKAQAEIDAEKKKRSKTDQDQQIERIVALYREDLGAPPTIVESAQLKGNDGNWYHAMGFPLNVNSTGERRVVGYVQQMKDGTTAGRGFKTREEAEQFQKDHQANKESEFRAALLEMSPERLNSQEEFWKSEKERKKVRKQPLPPLRPRKKKGSNQKPPSPVPVEAPKTELPGQEYSKAALKEAFQLTDDQAETADIFITSMVLPTAKMRITSDGVEVDGKTLFQSKHLKLERKKFDDNYAQWMTESELKGLSNWSTLRSFLDQVRNMPSVEEYAAAAIAGVSKIGWYAKSTAAIVKIFGKDAPRFAALLASLSPQISVETNLKNALKVWTVWVNGIKDKTVGGERYLIEPRTQDPAKILQIMGANVQGDKGEKSVMDAWRNNSIRSLTSENPELLELSGPKVNSFMLNLRGFINEVTNDTWVANFALLLQDIFRGKVKKGETIGRKGPGYFAMNARTREAAAYLTSHTGVEWSPSEVQETVWSWTKALVEQAESKTEKRAPSQIVLENDLSEQRIAGTPDFATLLSEDNDYSTILKEAGYRKQLNGVVLHLANIERKSKLKQDASRKAGNLTPHLESASRRIDQLLSYRRQRKPIVAAITKLRNQLEARFPDVKTLNIKNAVIYAAFETGDISAFGRSINGQPIPKALGQQWIIQNNRLDKLDSGMLGVNGMDFLAKERKGEKAPTTLFQAGPDGAHGAVTFINGGYAVLQALKQPNFSTAIHEIFHVARNFLLDLNIPQDQRAGVTDEDIRIAMKFAGVPSDGIWTEEADERLAKGFEVWVGEGKAPSPQLESVFAKIKNWMLDIYEKIAGSPLHGITLNDEIRGVFDRLLTRKDRLKPKESAPDESAFNPLGLKPGDNVLIRLRANLNRFHKAKVNLVTSDGITVSYKIKSKRVFMTLAPGLVSLTGAAQGIKEFHAQFEGMTDAQKKQVKADRRAFTDLLINEGHRFDWYNPEHETAASKNQLINRSNALKKARELAFIALGEPNTDSESAIEQARLLPKLREYIEANMPEEERQNAAWWKEVSLSKPGSVEVTSDTLSVGDVLMVDGEEVKVTELDEFDNITLEDGTKFGKQTLEHDEKIFVERVIHSESSSNTDFLPPEDDFGLDAPESPDEAKARVAAENAKLKEKAAKDEMAGKAAAPLKGTAGDLGQGDLLDGPKDLFAPPKPTPSKNVLVTDERAAIIRARMQARVRNVGSLVDLGYFSDAVQLGIYWIEKGFHRFADWLTAVKGDFGDTYSDEQLKSIYETARVTIESPISESSIGKPPGLQPGLRQPTDRIITARSEFTKQADESIIPNEDVRFLDAHQRQGAAAAIRSLLDRGGFLLADGTGAGKTRQALAVAHYFAKLGKKVIIITPKQSVAIDWKKKTFGGSYGYDSGQMGIKVNLARDGVVKPGEIGLTTYHNIASVSSNSDANTILIFDESHALKNDSQQAKHAIRAISRAERSMFMSATPADKPEHIYYLASIGVMEGHSPQKAMQDLGMALITMTGKDSNGRSYEFQKWVPDQRVTDTERNTRFSALFNRMTANGAMLKREIGMEGVHVQVLKIALPPEAHATMAKELTTAARAYRMPDDITIDDLKGLRKALVLGNQRRQQEPFKIASAVMLAQRELAAGRSVVIFVSRVNESESGYNERVKTLSGETEIVRHVATWSEGTAKLLREALEDVGIHDIAEIHGNAEQSSLEAMADFQSNKKRIVIATIEKGGTGINLDDVLGNHPRSMIVVTSPFDAVGNVQAAGRIWRLKTLSGANIFYLFGDTDVDEWNADIIGSKMAHLGAVVEGQVRRLDISDPENVTTDDYHENVSAPKKAAPPKSTVPFPKLDWKPFTTKTGRQRFVAPVTDDFWKWWNANGYRDNPLGLTLNKWNNVTQVWSDKPIAPTPTERQSKSAPVETESSKRDAAYLKAINDEDWNTARRIINEAAEASGLPILEDDSKFSFSYRRGPTPKKTIKAYKLFKMKNGKLYPLFIGADSEVPTGVWLDAKGEDFFVLDNRGRKRVPAKTGEWTTLEDGTKMKTLAFRPGWHSGDMPYAIQIAPLNESGEKSRYENDVWGEIEIAADQDYNDEALSNASRTKTGNKNMREAQLLKVPTDGFYRYTTNSNAKGTWYISGAVKVNRILTEKEVNTILKQRGITPMPWIGGKQNLSKFGITPGEKLNSAKLSDVVTRNDKGEIVLPSERFKVSSEDIRESRSAPVITPEQDAAYLAAVDAGDMETAQRMVDEAAKAAGYTVGPVWHGTGGKVIQKFSETAWFSEKRGLLMRYGGERGTVSAFVKVVNPIDLSQVKGFDMDAMIDARQVYEKAGLPVHPSAQYRYGRPAYQTVNSTEFIEAAKTAGYDGIRVKENNTLTWAIFNPSRIKSADPVTRIDGKVVPLSRRFDETKIDIRESKRELVVTPQQDASYMAAVNSGDTATAQRMVDEAAKKAKLVGPVAHGSKRFSGYVFDTNSSEMGSHFGTIKQAESFGKIRGFYVAVRNPFRVEDLGQFDPATIASFMVDRGIVSEEFLNRVLEMDAKSAISAVQGELKKHKYYGIVYLNRREGVKTKPEDEGTFEIEATDEEFKEAYPNTEDSYIVFDPSQIKSADPVTRIKGKVVPLSERFNEDSKDIRESVTEDKSSTTSNQISEEAATQAVLETLEVTELPSNITFINDPSPGANRGGVTYVEGELPQITINLAKHDSPESIKDTLVHELLHPVQDDIEMANAVGSVAAMVQEADLSRKSAMGYSADETAIEATNELIRQFYKDHANSNIFNRAITQVVLAAKRIFGIKLTAKQAAIFLVQDAIKNHVSKAKANGAALSRDETKAKSEYIKAGGTEGLFEKVITQIMGHDVLIDGKPQFTESDRVVGGNFTRQVLESIGLKTIEREQHTRMLDEASMSTPNEKAGQDLLEKTVLLRDNINNLFETNNERAGAKGTWLNSVRNIIMEMNERRAAGKEVAFSKALANDILEVAQSEASFIGMLLNSMRGMKDSVLWVARHADITLRSMRNEAFGGAAVENFIKTVQEHFISGWNSTQIKQLITDTNLIRLLTKHGNITEKQLIEMLRTTLNSKVSKVKDFSGIFADLFTRKFPADIEAVSAVFTNIINARIQKALDLAKDNAWNGLNAHGKNALNKRTPLWRRLNRALNDGEIDFDSAIKHIAERQGWVVPTPEQIEKLRVLVQREQDLRTLSEKELAAIEALPEDKREAAKEKAERDLEAVTASERADVIQNINTVWSRWVKPVSIKAYLNPFQQFEIIQNNAQAVNEWITANILLKLGFFVRQTIDVGVQTLFHDPTRALGVAMLTHKNELARGVATAEFWRDAGAALSETYKLRAKTLRHALAAGAQGLAGKGLIKHSEQITQRLGVFDRMIQNANDLDAQGKSVQAFALRLISYIRSAMLFSRAMDLFSTTGAEYAEIAHRIRVVMKENGKDNAAIKTQLDSVFGDMKTQWVEAYARARQVFEEKGIEPTRFALNEAAGSLVRERAYQALRVIDKYGGNYQDVVEDMANTIGWNEREVAGIGGFVGSLIRNVQRTGERAGVPLAFVSAFGNAIAIGINRKLTWMGLGKLAQVNGENAWYKSDLDREQRLAEGFIGVGLSAFLAGLTMLGVITVRGFWPRDDKEREKWRIEGRKGGTVELKHGEKFYAVSLSVGPLAVLAPLLIASGELKRALDTKAEQQIAANKEADKRGVKAEKITGLTPIDILSVVGSAFYASLLNSRTLGGTIGSYSPAGEFNPKQVAATITSSVAPVLPGYQDAMRIAGVYMNPKLATFGDLLVPYPTSGGRRTNVLGDPSGSFSTVQQILQTLTGGTFGPIDPNISKKVPAYAAMFHANYVPSQPQLSKGYVINGAWRTMTPTENRLYVPMLGKMFATELGAIASDVLTSEQTEAKKLVQAAYKRANTSALEKIGVDVEASKIPTTRQSAEPAPTRRLSRSAPVDRTESISEREPSRRTQEPRTVSGDRGDRVERRLVASSSPAGEGGGNYQTRSTRIGSGSRRRSLGRIRRGRYRLKSTSKIARLRNPKLPRVSTRLKSYAYKGSRLKRSIA